MGGLGGFFPPLLLAFFRSRTGAIWPGFAAARRRPRWLLWWANHRVFVPRQQALDIALPADLRRTADRLRAGAWATLWTALAGRRHRGRLAQSAELRSGAGDLHVRGGLRHLGRGLPLQRLAGKAADARLLGPRLGTVPAQRRAAQPGPRGCAGRHSPGRAALHRAPLAPALVDAPMPLLGLPAGGRHHLSRWSSAGFTSARCPATR